MAAAAVALPFAPGSRTEGFAPRTLAVPSYILVVDRYLAVAVETTEGRLQRHTNSSVSDLSATGICPKANR